jgi:hypothetical protein
MKTTVAKSSRLQWTGHVAREGDTRNAYRILIGKLTGKCLLARPRRGQQDNIKMEHRKISSEDGRWMELAQDRVQWRTLVLTVSNLFLLQ